jgi:hypothetical protein
MADMEGKFITEYAPASNDLHRKSKMGLFVTASIIPYNSYKNRYKYQPDFLFILLKQYENVARMPSD